MRLVLLLASATLAIAGEFTRSVGDTYPFQIMAITTDAIGNTYAVGSRLLDGSYTSPVGIFDPVTGLYFLGPLPTDVFVTKLDPAGKVLFTDIFSGKGVDTGNAIALDPSGNIYVAGSSTSDDFPLSKALQSQSSTSGTGFIVKLTNDGSTILYSTYFGGTLGASSITSLATDSQGNLYLTGSTSAADFPHTAGMPFGQMGPVQVSVPGLPGVTSQATGAILASISAAGDKIRYAGVLVGYTTLCPYPSACFFPSSAAGGAGIAVDPSGSAYIAGNTDTIDVPGTSGVLSPKGEGAFVAKVNSTGTGLSYLTFIDLVYGVPSGPLVPPPNTLTAIAVDAAGNAYLGGYTWDRIFPTTPGSLQPTFPALPASTPYLVTGFLAKLKPDASALLWATYLGGLGASVQSLAIDPFGNVWATGTTPPPNAPEGAPTAALPNTNGWSTGTEFLTSVNATGSELSYSALYPAGTVAQTVALDPAGYVHVAGSNGFLSSISPYQAPSMEIFGFQNVAGGNLTARVSPEEVISIYGPGIGPATAVTATPSAGFYPKTLAGVQVSIASAATSGSVVLPLLYVSANQINAVVPMEIVAGAAATVQITNGAATSPAFPVWIVASAPQAFPAILNQDGTLNSGSNPAKSGYTVTFYTTGWQSNFGPLRDGEVATQASDICLGKCTASYPTLSPAVSSAIAPSVPYAGAAPGIVAGVTQLNVNIGALPPSWGAGASAVTLFITGPGGSPAIYQMVCVTP